MQCTGFSLQWLFLLQSAGSRALGLQQLRSGLVTPWHVGIFLDQVSNPCPLHWQADSLPLSHQGSPLEEIIIYVNLCAKEYPGSSKV